MRLEVVVVNPPTNRSLADSLTESPLRGYRQTGMVNSGAGAARRLGRYHLSDPLGGGPTGEVFRAKVYGVAGFERQFAVKRFHAEFVKDPDIARQVAGAARMYGSLEHPRIARLHEYGITNGETFTTTELVTGLDLARLSAALESDTRLVSGAVVALVSQVARTVGYAHGRGISHLGICPTNLICTPEGDVKVTDFGFLPPRLPDRPANDYSLQARIPYLAPEQLANEPTSSATDVFQLAVVACELLEGRRCFTGPTPFEVAQEILSGRPPDLDLPKPLLKVLLRCLARSPFERFPDAGAFADALDAAIRATPLPGDKRDASAAVKRSTIRLQEMSEQQISGALSFPLPAPPPPGGTSHPAPTAGAVPVAVPPAIPAQPPAIPPAAASRPAARPAPARPSTPLAALLQQGAPPPRTAAPEHEEATIPRHTLMGAVAPRIIEHEDDAPTQVRQREGLVDVPAFPGGDLPTPPPILIDPSVGGDAIPTPNSVIGGESGGVLVDPIASMNEEPEPPEIEMSVQGDIALEPALPAPFPIAQLPLGPQGEPLAPAAKPRRSSRFLIALLGLVVLGAGGFVVYDRFIAGSADSSTVAAPTPAGAGDAAVVARANSDAAPAPRAATRDGGTAARPDDAATVARLPPDAAVVVDAATAVASKGPDAAMEVIADDSGQLKISSTPSRAEVYLDGARKGKTPLTLAGVGDKQSLALIKAGYKLHLAEIDGQGQVKVALVPVTPTAGAAGIKVRCKKKNRYYVFVDGYDVGQLCPTERIGVEKGPHEVVIYDPVTEQRHAFRVTVNQTRNSLRVRVD